jgi:hypothetical protein
MNQGAIEEPDRSFKGTVCRNQFAQQLSHFLTVDFNGFEPLPQCCEKIELIEREAFHCRVSPKPNSFWV